VELSSFFIVIFPSTILGENMKRIFLVLPLAMILLSACAAPSAATLPAESEITVVPANTEVILIPTDEVPGMKLPAPSFEAQTYIDEKFGFAFDYPSGWTVSEPMYSERATQVQFLSTPELLNAATVPAGATRVSATVYEWDPKNDLAAAVANWKTAWDASGFTVLEEEELVLEQGLPAMQFTVQTPDATVVHLITTLGDRYLMLSGEGDLELVQEIVQRIRPISVK
jgi:hypothetical protein